MVWKECGPFGGVDREREGRPVSARRPRFATRKSADAAMRGSQFRCGSARPIDAKQRRNLIVIPGRCEASNPESRDSGSGACAPSQNDGGKWEDLLMRILQPA